jgi:adenine C2-methylase RlmN of 23S rRNA A2503 and tRNA A37
VPAAKKTTQEKKLLASARKQQLLRWFHERSYRELEAMRTALEQANRRKTESR